MYPASVGVVMLSLDLEKLAVSAQWMNKLIDSGIKSRTQAMKATPQGRNRAQSVKGLWDRTMSTTDIKDIKSVHKSHTSHLNRSLNHLGSLNQHIRNRQAKRDHLLKKKPVQRD